MCNRIGTTLEELFANLGVELEYYGMLYLCQDCCNEVVSFMEAMPKDTAELYALTFNDLRAQLAAALNENQYLRRLLDVRIESAGRGEFDGDDSASVSISKIELAATGIDPVFDDDKSESLEPSEG